MPFTEEMSNLEKLMFSHCTGDRETFSSMGILTKYGFAPIRHFPDFVLYLAYRKGGQHVQEIYSG